MKGPHPEYIYDSAPRNVYWEMTLACDLACKHCRANAMPNRNALELSTEEGKILMDDVKNMRSMMVLTGGDPMKRPDLFELMEYAKKIRLPLAITPSATKNLTHEAMGKFRDLGITALGISLDGPDAASHDELRGVKGTFEASEKALMWAKEFGLPVQINTTVSRETIKHLPAMFDMLSKRLSPPVTRWSIFLIVPVGRGTVLEVPKPEEIENTFAWIYKTSKTAPFHISMTEAPHYRRYLVQQKLNEGMQENDILKLARKFGLGIRDGNGVIFVSHTGEVYPAGFLPLSVGNVRTEPLNNIYRTSPILMNLRDMNKLTGKCGACEFRWMCGGSRARAYALSGNIMGSDPFCAHEP